MARTQDLFADDSSDSSDSSQEEAPPKETGANENDDDDSSGDEAAPTEKVKDEETTPDAETAAPTPATTSTPATESTTAPETSTKTDDKQTGDDSEKGGGGGGGGDDDDDDDDEDAEFDDNDGIVGMAAKETTTSDGGDNAGETSVIDGVSNDRDDEMPTSSSRGDDGGGGNQSDGAGSRPKRASRPPRTIEVLDIPRPVPKGSKATLHVTKLPNILNINTDAFDLSTYNPAEEDKRYKGHVHNIIRWRYKKDKETEELVRDKNGKLIRESNTRMVRWSDGSTTLHVGDEVFEVDELNTTQKNGFAGLNGYLYITQKATNISSSGENTPGGTILECMGAIKSRITARPSSVQSTAHKNLKLVVRQKNMKKARIAEFNAMIDPEKEKNERIKNKEDLNREVARGAASGSRRTQTRRRPGMNRYYLESNDDPSKYDSVDLNALKRRGRDDDDMGYGAGRYREESGSDEDEYMMKKRNALKKARKGAREREDDIDEEEEEEEEDIQVESDDEEEINFASGRKRNRQAVVDEDDE